MKTFRKTTEGFVSKIIFDYLIDMFGCRLFPFLLFISLNMSQPTDTTFINIGLKHLYLL